MAAWWVLFRGCRAALLGCRQSSASWGGHPSLGGLTKHAGFTPGPLWHVLQRKTLELPSEEGQCGEISGGGGLPPLPLQELFGHGPSWAGGGGRGAGLRLAAGAREADWKINCIA